MNALLEALQKRRKIEREDAYRRAGVVAAATINVHRGRGQRAIQPEEFVPKTPKRVTAEQFKAIMSGWAQQTNNRNRSRS